jgi:hypothetical protein
MSHFELSNKAQVKYQMILVGFSAECLAMRQISCFSISVSYKASLLSANVAATTLFKLRVILLLDIFCGIQLGIPYTSDKMSVEVVRAKKCVWL